MKNNGIDIDATGMKPLDVKLSMLEGMFHNFKKHGYLTPMVFSLANGEISLEQVPGSFFESRQDKQRLAAVLRQTGKNPKIKCMGLIFEAWGTIQVQDSEMTKLLMSGNLRVSELSTRLDIICMVFSSRTEDDLLSYVVDPETRTIKEKFIAGADPEGIFSNLLEKRP